ncbi:DUF3606 domain-containing protein [Lysobacter yananisis]|uniref:DUF3606 domain-containing protein n=1 Tax=Lysobacter yananisis TaxID=1003114 RepID=A0ABY9PGY0_9GAMM|nr:DUF3606 domain-containing protein [Lysobacter yananisis]WMT05698.1 DUF3606 domain-containing protein [Lysobacter yananisis]
MSDDSDRRGPQDRARISLEQAHELRYWTERFGVDERRLREAVAAVGVSVDAVERHLRANG